MSFSSEQRTRGGLEPAIGEHEAVVTVPSAPWVSRRLPEAPRVFCAPPQTWKAAAVNFLCRLARSCTLFLLGNEIYFATQAQLSVSCNMQSLRAFQQLWPYLSRPAGIRVAGQSILKIYDAFLRYCSVGTPLWHAGLYPTVPCIREVTQATKKRWAGDLCGGFSRRPEIARCTAFRPSAGRWLMAMNTLTLTMPRDAYLYCLGHLVLAAARSSPVLAAPYDVQ